MSSSEKKKKKKASENELAQRREKLDRAARLIQGTYRQHAEERQQRILEAVRSEERHKVSPEAILADRHREWLETKRAERQPGFVTSFVTKGHGVIPPPSKSGDLIAGMSRMDILMSGNHEVMIDGEPPYGFGPAGPSDKDVVAEVVRASEVKKRRTSRASSPKKASSPSRTPSGGKGQSGRRASSPSRKSLRNLSKTTPLSSSRSKTTPLSSSRSARARNGGAALSDGGRTESAASTTSNDASSSDDSHTAAASGMDGAQQHEVGAVIGDGAMGARTQEAATAPIAPITPSLAGAAGDGLAA